MGQLVPAHNEDELVVMTKETWSLAYFYCIIGRKGDNKPHALK